MQYHSRTSFTDRLDRATSITNKHPLVLRYALAFCLIALVTVVKLGLDFWIGRRSPFLLDLPAILLSAWIGGTGTGLFALMLSMVAIEFFFLAPYWSFSLANIGLQLSQLIIFGIEGLLIVAIVHWRNRAYDEMQARTSQQAVIAAIGQYGLEEQDLSSLMQKVTRTVAKALDVDFVKILELLPDQNTFLLRAGTGWKRGSVGRTRVKAHLASQAGFALEAKKPVIVTDLSHERRFEDNELLQSYGITSGVSVMISGEQQPYGVLSVHTKEKRIFSKSDVNFLQAIANVLAATIQRQRNQQNQQLLAQINDVLLATLDVKKTLSGIVDVVVPQFADLCEIYLKKSGKEAEVVEIGGVQKEKRKLLEQIAKEYPPTERSRRITALALRSGKPQYVSQVSSTQEEKIAEDKRHAELMKKLQLRSVISVPLKIRHQAIGVMTFVTIGKGHIYTQADLQIAKEIAVRAAVAIDNATLYQDAKEAVQARDEFLSIASHELKTPLTSMLLQLQTVLHSIKSESLANFSIDKTMTMLESTISQSKRLSKLVNDLLNISLITTGRLELEKEEVDLTKVTKEVVSRLEETAEKSGSTLAFEGKGKITGKWDKIRLEQVVTNLITNGIKYGASKPVMVKVSNSNNIAQLQVSDQGIGIPEDQKKIIFNRFERGDVKGSYKGLGVGLYLVNEIVKAHGGKVEVESKPHQGSTFTVKLPLKK